MRESMAAGEEEYDSDPEEERLPLALRRREASDDEEEGGEVREKPRRIDRRVASDGESDGEGGAPDEDEDSQIEEEEEEEEGEEEFEEVEEESQRVFEDSYVQGRHEDRDLGITVDVPESSADGQGPGGEQAGLYGNNQVQGEKKESEPYAVPTAGAFYMHDDRFRDSGGGRRRRMPGGRKLWESKDDRKWGHDKFEELSLREIHYEEKRRTSKGRLRGRGKNRVTDRGYITGNRSAIHNEGSNQNYTSKTVRGRGPRKYEPPTRNRRDTPPTKKKQSGKSPEITSNISSGKASSHISNVQSDMVIPRKHVFASSLSSASPPFYPSSSSNQDISVTQKSNGQAGGTSRNFPVAVVEENFSTRQSISLPHGKTIANSAVQGRVYRDGFIDSAAEKPSGNLQLQSSGSSSINKMQSPQSRAQGRGLSGPLTYQPTSHPPNPSHQVNKVSLQTQLHVVQQRAAQSPVQSLARVSTQPLNHHTGNGNQAASPPKFSSSNASEHGEMDPTPGSGSKMTLVGKGKGSAQGGGRGSFLYGGPQGIGATGNMGVAHADQNFSGTPALFPVMQFGGQHSGGLGVPAVGMALPGYVAQPQLGFGNSEMTWLPVLAGAAGALGATYCSPYLAVDGGYYSRSAGQTSSSGTLSKEMSTSKTSNSRNPPERHELVNDEFGQRQNKPRRYSEMNFGQ